MSSRVWIFAAFGCYLLAMMGIGVFYYKRTKNSEDYFLGGRSLNGWVAALSAQASDMSGWLLMGLPGAIYAFGRSGSLWGLPSARFSTGFWSPPACGGIPSKPGIP